MVMIIETTPHMSVNRQRMSPSERRLVPTQLRNPMVIIRIPMRAAPMTRALGLGGFLSVGRAVSFKGSPKSRAGLYL